MELLAKYNNDVKVSGKRALEVTNLALDGKRYFLSLTNQLPDPLTIQKITYTVEKGSKISGMIEYPGTVRPNGGQLEVVVPRPPIPDYDPWRRAAIYAELRILLTIHAYSPSLSFSQEADVTLVRSGYGKPGA